MAVFELYLKKHSPNEISFLIIYFLLLLLLVAWVLLRFDHSKHSTVLVDLHSTKIKHAYSGKKEETPLLDFSFTGWEKETLTVDRTVCWYPLSQIVSKGKLYTLNYCRPRLWWLIAPLFSMFHFSSWHAGQDWKIWRRKRISRHFQIRMLSGYFILQGSWVILSYSFTCRNPHKHAETKRQSSLCFTESSMLFYTVWI